MSALYPEQKDHDMPPVDQWGRVDPTFTGEGTSQPELISHTIDQSLEQAEVDNTYLDSDITAEREAAVSAQVERETPAELAAGVDRIAQLVDRFRSEELASRL